MVSIKIPWLCCTEPVVNASMGELQHVVFRLLLAFKSAPASKQNLSTIEIYRTFPFPRFCELILFKYRHEDQVAVRFFDPERFSIRILSFHSPFTLSAGFVSDRARLVAITIISSMDLRLSHISS